MVFENVNVGVTPLVSDMGSILREVVSPMVAVGAPLADHVDKVLIDSVGVAPLAMAGGGGLSSGIAGAASRAVALRWRPQQTLLLGWRSRPLLGRRPWPLLSWRPQPTRWRRQALPVCAAHSVTLTVWSRMIM